MKKIITTVAAVFVATTAVHADVLAAWDLSGTAAGSSSAPVDSVGAGLSSSDLAASATALTSTRIAPGIGWVDGVGTYAENWRLSNAIEFALQEDIYYGFTLTPDAGKTVSFDNMFARFAVNAGATTSDVTFTLMSSQTGFSTNSSSILGTYNAVNLTAGAYAPSYYTTDFDLSGEAALQDVASATEFRIYFNSAEGNRMAIGKTWSGLTGDDLRVDGSVIPEPSTLALVGLASAGMLLFRKRFHI